MRKVCLTCFIMIAILYIYCINANAFTIVLDPGHGGRDTGAVSDDGSETTEREVNMKIARYLREYLNRYDNVKVILTHEGIAGDSELSIFNRAMVARNNKADIFISLHNNSIEIGTADGGEVYVSANTSLPKYNQETTALAEKVLINLNKLGIRSRGVKTRLIPTDETDIYSDGTRADYYGIIRYAMRGCAIDEGVIKYGTPANVQNGEGIPTILIEHCFMIGSDFTNYLNTDEKIKKVAEADGKAIVEHYGLKTKEEAKELKNIVVQNDSYNMLVGDTIHIHPIAEPLISTAKFTYISADESIATVNEAGIITAVSEGNTKIVIGNNENNITKEITLNIIDSEEYSITINEYDVKDQYISKIEPGTKVSEVLEQIELSNNLTITVKNDTNEEVDSDEYVTTGLHFIITNKETGNIIKEYITIIYGDADCDGEITSRDLYNIQRHILKKTALKDAGCVAANLDKNYNEPTSRDLYNIQRHILKKATIKQ